MKGYKVWNSTFIPFNNNLSPNYPLTPSSYTASNYTPSFQNQRPKLKAQNFKPHILLCASLPSPQASSASTAQAEEQEVEIARGYTMTQFCDKMIDFFLNEKTKSKEWKKYLIFREEWKKYSDRFFSRCQRRADMENDPVQGKIYFIAEKVEED
uniref:Uncharacterized protein n=1 Tax=Glycine max TaxID=3847 RepID=C6T508_SOYBN|nr:unknown [Glycine max]